MEYQSQQIPTIPCKIRGFENPMLYVSTVLKSEFGGSDEFLAFERQYYYQSEELKSLKSTCEELRNALSKAREEKRSLELQLITEKALRDQEAKNAEMEIEKQNVQLNAQLHTMKCEVETWKRKCEAITTECTWLKDQMKTIEIEKNQTQHKMTDMRNAMNDFELYRQSFDSYSSRLKMSIEDISKKLVELEKAKGSLEMLSQHNQQQLDMMSSQIVQWNDERGKLEEKISALERELMKAKSELAQDVSKVARSELTERKSAELVSKLLEENKHLQEGLCVLSQAIGNQINESHQQLLQKTTKLHQEVDNAVNRLHMTESDFTPPSDTNS